MVWVDLVCIGFSFDKKREVWFQCKVRGLTGAL